METIFSRLQRGDLPCAKIYDDGVVFAFMDAGQVNPGHVIVASVHPFVTLTDADEATAVALMRVAHQVARAVQAAFKPEGLTILQANSPAGWQTVPHLHLHVLPRYANDGVTLTWPRKEPGMAVLLDLAAKIRL